MLRSLRNKKGVILLWTAVAALALFGIGAFAVDLGNLWLARNELQKAADAAALAGASAMGTNYNEIFKRARVFAAKNQAAGEVINLNFDQIEVGLWDQETETFTPYDPFSQEGANAVRVTASRNYHGNSPVRLWFGRILGKEDAGLQATAIAVGSGRPASTMSPYVIYTMDCSNSMVDSGTKSKGLAQDLLQYAETAVLNALVTKVGLIYFESKANLEQPLTLNTGEVYKKIDQLQFGKESPEIANNVGQALEISLTHLVETPEMVPEEGKVTFLFSDGMFSEEEKAKAAQQAERAKELKYPIYTFGIGSSIDEAILKEIAQTSGGEYFSYEDILARIKDSRDNYIAWLVK